VTSFQYSFNGARRFASELSQWDVSSATDLLGMFSGAHAFNSNLDNWAVGKVTKLNDKLSLTSMIDA